MNAYDLDQTILKGDSEDFFFDYCFSHLNLSKKARFKFKFYGWLRAKLRIDWNFTRPHQYYFLKEIDDIDKVLEDFWDEHFKYIKKWYLDQKKDDDIISTASPVFLEIPLMRRLGLKNLIGTNLDKKTAKLTGIFNYSEEKVRTLKLFTNEIPEEFYSDSDRDIPMAKYAKKAFKVIDDERIPWNPQ